MRQFAGRAVCAPAPDRTWVGWSAGVALLLAAVMTPHAGQAAPPAVEADLVGAWMTDKNDPGGDYLVELGPSADALRITVPAKVLRRPLAETLTLERIGPREFSTPKGGSVRATFKVTQPRHATFRRVQDDPKSFNMGYNLLEKR